MSVVTCTIVINGKKLPLNYPLLNVAVSKQVNYIPSATFTIENHIDLISRERLIDDPLFNIGNEVEILLRYERARNKEQSVFKGIIVRQISTIDFEGSEITIELQDKTCGLEKRIRIHKFQYITDTEIIKSLIENGGAGVGEIPAFQTKPSEVVQSKCSDWEFLLERAKINKLLVLVNNGEVSLKKPEIIGSPKHHFEYGMTEIYNFSLQKESSPLDALYIHGDISIPGIGNINLLEILQLKGMGKTFDGNHLITGIKHIVDEDGWVTKVQFGFTESN